MERKLMWLCLLFGASVLIGGCAWRAENTEHYWGPVLFRYTAPPQGNAYVSEQRHFLILIEGGRQWGISIGWKTRVSASAQRIEGEPTGGEKAQSWRWSKPLSLFAGPVEGRWNLSLLYLRGEQVPKPEFLSRSLYGTELAIGTEANALSVGASTTTELRPRTNALYAFRYDGHLPMETLFQVWEYKDGQFPRMLLQEAGP